VNIRAPILAAILIVVAPQFVEAQGRHVFAGPPRTSSLGRPWSSLDFGAPRIAPAPRPTPGGQWRSMFDKPLDESPWRHVPFPGRTSQRGDLVRAPMFEVHAFAAPIDCAMAKPGDPTLDPKFVRPTPTHRTHSGVIIPVAPCRGK